MIFQTIAGLSFFALSAGMALPLAGPAAAQPTGELVEPIATRVDLTGGRLALFADSEGTAGDYAIAMFAREAGIAAPLPDPTVTSSTVRFTSDTADSADGGIVTLDRANWRRSGKGFVYEAHPVRGPAPGGIIRVLLQPGRRGGKLMIWALGDRYGAHPISGPVAYVQVALAVGPVTYVGRFQAPPAKELSNSSERVFLSGRNASVEAPPGHELVDLRDFPNIVVWGTQQLTTEQYDALELPAGWRRNQPRAGVGASGRFLRTPGLASDGEFTREELFGTTWLHQASIAGFGGPLDEEGLLNVTFIDKHHELSWRAGSRVRILTSPDGEAYILVSRDDRRTSDTPTIPEDWAIEDVLLEEDLTVTLPLPTHNIRADNEDSFQGPLPSDLEF